MTELDRSRLRYCVVHRLSFAHFHPTQNPEPVADDMLTVDIVNNKFRNPELRTGGSPPYHIHVDQNGIAHVALSLDVMGAHAYGYNHVSIGVAAYGNTDEFEMSTKQYDGLLETVTDLCCQYRLTLRGHDELPGACRDPTKRCPGRFLPMDALRRAMLDKIYARVMV